MSYGSTLHIPPTNYHLIAAQREPDTKAYLLTKMLRAFSGERKVRRMDRKQKNDTTRRRGRMTFKVLSTVKIIIMIRAKRNK